MRNVVQLLGLAAALLTVSCHAFGTARGLALVAALVTGALAWIAHRGHARAGGGTADTGSTGSTGSTESTTDADTTGSSTGSGSGSTEASTTGSTSADAGTLDSTASAGTAEPTSTTNATSDEGFETSACLSIGPPDEFGPCLCACEIDDDRDATDWAPALLLPAVALRRRSRRASLDRIAADGRLPEDVVARLRQRMDAERPK
jgi:hypothetical protein